MLCMVICEAKCLKIVKSVSHTLGATNAVLTISELRSGHVEHRERSKPFETFNLTLNTPDT